MEIYFDNAATTRIYPEAAEIMMKVLQEDYGNPSSLHKKGITAEHYIKEASETIAKTMKADSSEIFFTSGGTEANNLALIGTAMAHKRQGMHIISSAIEHASVKNTLDFLAQQGFEVTYIGTDEHGKVRAEDFSEAVREDTILVSCMYVNNEIGSIQPVQEIAKLVKKKNPKIVMHVDAIQAYGKIPVYPEKIGADLVSISAHKIHGPKGMGALYVRKKTLIKPILYGGGQQRKLRSGTENVPGIAGFGAAVRKTFEDQEEKIKHISEIKDYLIENLTAFPDVYSNSQDAPHIASISFTGIRSEVMLHALEEAGIYVSSGSACSSNKKEVSSVLTAINLPEERLESTLRLSFGEDNTMEEAEYTVNVVSELLPKLRKYIRK